VTAVDIYWDPFEPALRDDPYPLWRRLRDDAPLYRNDRYDFWTLSRFHDVEAAHRDHATYSSAHGTTIELMTPEPNVDTGLFIALDPPKHTNYRGLVSRAFTPRRIAGIQDRIRAVAARLLDAQIGSGGFDYVQDFSAVLPPAVISTLLGLPAADEDHLRHLVDTIFHIEEGVGIVNPIAQRAMGEVRAYLLAQLDERRRAPRDDLLTVLVEADVTEADGTVHRLDPEVAADFGLMLFVAGTETVARMLGWAASVLAEHPDQRAELHADPARIPNAVEELLRFEAPSPVQARWTTRDVELHGTVVPKDSKVVLLTGAAGRDERKYDDPDRFDIHRAFDHHVTLGFGIHYCLGAALARMEGCVGIEETLRRFPTWEVDRDNAHLLYTSTVRGYQNLPIVV
jgi:cytochrome P450